MRVPTTYMVKIYLIEFINNGFISIVLCLHCNLIIIISLNN